MAEGTKVGEIFYESRIDPSGVQKGSQDITNSLDKLKGSFGSLTPVLKTFGLALSAAFVAKKMVDYMVAATQTAARTETLGVAMYAVAKATNTSTELLKEQEVALRKQGITTQEARSTLTKFMQSQLDVAQATDIARVAQDLAVIAGENSSETVNRLTLAIAAQRPMILREVGIVADLRDIYDAYGKTIGKAGDELTSTQRKQAMVNLILTEGKKVAGAYELSMTTLGKKLTTLPRLFEEARNAIGQVFLPVGTLLIDMLSSILKAVPDSNLLLAPFRVLSTFLYVLIMQLKQVGILMGAIFGGIYTAFTQGIGAGVARFKSGMVDMVATSMTGAKDITQIWGKETDKRADITGSGMQKEIDASSKKSAKLKKDLEDETEKYREELAKRNKRFDDSMADLIWSHQDKVKELEKDIAEENKDFKKSMAERVRDYKESLEEMTADHDKHLAELNKDLSEEKTENEDKVKTIQALIDKELSYGKNARQSKIIAWKEQLAEETESYNKKVADIQEKIDEENQSFTDQTAKAKAENDQRTADLLEAHNERLANYQTQVDAENTILNAHQTEVDAIKNKARVDDIQRLIDQHAEENAEASKQHDKRMADIVESSKSEAAAGGAAFNQASAEKLEEAKKLFDEKTKEMAGTMITNLTTGAKDAAKALIKNFVNGIIDAARSAWSFVSGHAKRGGEMILDQLKDLMNIPHLATGVRDFGGGLALVGERGPELVNLPRGSDVYPSGTTPAQNIYVNIDHMSNDQDMDALVRELGFKISQLPSS